MTFVIIAFPAIMSPTRAPTLALALALALAVAYPAAARGDPPQIVAEDDTIRYVPACNTALCPRVGSANRGAVF